METKFTRALYDHSPNFLKDAFASCYGWQKKRQRYGKIFRAWYDFYRESALWTRSELEAYQDEKLHEIVCHAYDHTPFYRQRMDDANLNPADINCVEDLKKLPLLEKDDVRKYGEELLSDAYSSKHLFAHPTSGSTGMPMMLYSSLDSLEIEYGFVWARRRPGVKRGDPYASFTGLQLIKPSTSKPPFWRNNWAANQRMYSVFHMNDNNLPAYVQNLAERRISYMEGYPAPIYLIAEYIERTGTKADIGPKAIFSTSEELQPSYRETIERVFDTKVWDMYGQGEYAAAISECPCGHMHYDMDYGIIEFVEIGRVDGLVKAEMVCTGFYNFAWPMIRYRVGDVALYDPQEQLTSECVNQGPIIKKILGRTGRYFILPDGTKVTNISVIAKKCNHVVTMQVFQEKADEFEILVQKAPGFSKDDERTIYDMFTAKLGGELKMKVRYVNKPLLTKSGKFLSIITKL